jgi:hypothetical protein
VPKKAKKTVVRREYTKADVKELRAHSKANHYLQEQNVTAVSVRQTVWGISAGINSTSNGAAAFNAARSRAVFSG